MGVCHHLHPPPELKPNNAVLGSCPSTRPSATHGVCRSKIIATLEDGTKAYADVLVGADGIWSQIRKLLHGLGDGAGGFAASGAAGGALDDAEARKLARDTIKIAATADRRYSGFT